MKRIFALLLVALTLAGCATKEKIKTKGEPVKSDPCEFLINADWVGDDDACENHIGFRKDGSFSNYCACGSPIGDGDIIEEYSYNATNIKIKKDRLNAYPFLRLCMGSPLPFAFIDNYRSLWYIIIDK